MSGHRFLFLDALRGIAALLVALYHSAFRITTRWPDAATGDALTSLVMFLNLGRAGVTAFFLISGFVIPSSLGESRPGGLRSFAVRRFFRLYPAFWLSVAAGVLVIHAGRGTWPGVANLLANLTMAPGFFGQGYLQGMYWTLQMELVFYVLCVLLFRAGRLRHGPTLRNLSLGFVALFLVLWLSCRGSLRGETSSDFVYLPFILGLMLIGALCRQAHDTVDGAPGWWFRGAAARDLWLAAFPWALFPVAMMALPVAQDVLLGGGAAHFGRGHLLGAGLFIAGLACLRKRPPRVLLLLGASSYSMYLFHGLAIDVTVWMVEDWGIGFLSGRHPGVYLAMMLAGTVVVGAVAYYSIEKRFIALGRRISGRQDMQATSTLA